MKFIKLVVVLLFVTLSFNACSQKEDKSEDEKTKNSTEDEKSSEDMETETTESDSVLVPSFEIELQLTEAAENKIKNNDESVIFSFMFLGNPTDKNLIDPSDGVGDKYLMANKDFELVDERVLKVENVKIAKEVYDNLADKDYEINVNVFTGRRTFETNLISCGIIQDKISKLKGKRHVIKGGLI